MAARAALAPGVARDLHLRKARRPRHVGFVAAGAEHTSVGPDRLLLRGIRGVTRERAVASLAAHVLVRTTPRRVCGIGVAVEAGGPAGVDERPCAVVVERLRAVVAVAPEALGHEQRLQRQENEQGRREERPHSEQMPGVPEESHRLAPRSEEERLPLHWTDGRKPREWPGQPKRDEATLMPKQLGPPRAGWSRRSGAK